METVADEESRNSDSNEAKPEDKPQVFIRKTRSAAKKEESVDSNGVPSTSPQKISILTPSKSTDDTSGKGSSSQGNRQINIGSIFQAEISPLLQDSDPVDDSKQRATCFWDPEAGARLSDSEIEEFCDVAALQFGYGVEQALGLLHWHQYDLSSAMADLGSYVPLRREWTTEDKVLYEQAFSLHGKNFARIKQILPHKPMASLVDYYYLWKKTRSFTSYMDTRDQEEDSDDDEEDDDANGKKVQKQECTNCNQAVQTLTKAGEASLCNACSIYYKRTQEMRPCKKKTAVEDDTTEDRRKGLKCPSGIPLTEEALEQFTRRLPKPTDEDGAKAAPTTEGDKYLKQLEFRIYGLKQKAAKNYKCLQKQFAEQLKGGLEEWRPKPLPKTRTSNAWTDDEIKMAIQGFRRYGKRFDAIAGILRTKNMDQVKNFYRDFNMRYKLDQLISGYEEEKTRRETELEESLAETAGTGPDSDTIDLIDDDDSGPPPVICSA